MKKKFLTTISISLLSLPFLAFSSQKLIISGQGWTELAILDKDTSQIEWAYTPQAPKKEAGETAKAPAAKNAKNAKKNSKAKKAQPKANKHGVSVNCVNPAKNGNIAFSTGFSAMVVSKDKEIVWQYDASPTQEIHYVSQLDNGNYLVGICGLPSLILELDENKNIVNKISFDSKNDNVHSQFRHVSSLKNGNYIVALLKTATIIELDKSGNILETHPMKGIMPSGIFGAYELKNGNLVVSGDAGKIIEYDKANKKVVREITNDNLDGADILFACQVVELENGNLLVANWNGHSKDKTQPKLIEIDQNNKVVWKLENSERITNLAAVQVLE